MTKQKTPVKLDCDLSPECMILQDRLNEAAETRDAAFKELRSALNALAEKSGDIKVGDFVKLESRTRRGPTFTVYLIDSVTGRLGFKQDTVDFEYTGRQVKKDGTLSEVRKEFRWWSTRSLIKVDPQEVKLAGSN
jgi:hypothetical protein